MLGEEDGAVGACGCVGEEMSLIEVVAEGRNDNVARNAQMGDNLTEEERREMRNLLAKFERFFRRDALPIAEVNGHVYEQRIDTGLQGALCPFAHGGRLLLSVKLSTGK